MLYEYLKKSNKSKYREDIFKLKLLYDIKLEAAKYSCDLHIHSPDVDYEGFDIIISDWEASKKIQLKTKLYDSSTSSWTIQKRHLRPTYENHAKLGYFFTGVFGHEGGILVSIIDPRKDPLVTSYLYTDIFVITAFMNGIIAPKNKITLRRTTITKLWAALHEGSSPENIEVRKSLFLSTPDILHLIRLIGLNPGIDDDWRWELLHALNASESNDYRLTKAKSVFNTLNGATTNDLVFNFGNKLDNNKGL